MGVMASQITSLMIVYSTVYSVAQIKVNIKAPRHWLLCGEFTGDRIHRGPVNSPHKWPVTRKMFPFDDVIMCYCVPVSLMSYSLNTVQTRPDTGHVDWGLHVAGGLELISISHQYRHLCCGYNGYIPQVTFKMSILAVISLYWLRSACQWPPPVPVPAVGCCWASQPGHHRHTQGHGQGTKDIHICWGVAAGMKWAIQDDFCVQLGWGCCIPDDFCVQLS